MDVKKWWTKLYDSRLRHIVEEKLNEHIYWPSGLELTDEAVQMLSECSLAYKNEEYQTLVAETAAHELKNTLRLRESSIQVGGPSKFRTFKVNARTIMDAVGKADWEINRTLIVNRI